MKLTTIIAALRERCPRFENRVGGAAQFKAIPDAGKLRLPAAYVVPSDDAPGEQKSQTDYWQDLTEASPLLLCSAMSVMKKGSGQPMTPFMMSGENSGKPCLDGCRIRRGARLFMPVAPCWI